MKIDPYPYPISLSHPPANGWRYQEKNMRKPARYYNFWAGAKLLTEYRKANNLPRASFDDAQHDILCHERRRRGLSCDANAYAEAELKAAKLREWKQRHGPRARAGCRSCGGKRR